MPSCSRAPAAIVAFAAAVAKCHRAVVVDENWKTGGLAAEVGQKMPVGTVMATLLEAGEAGEAAGQKVGAGATAPFPAAPHDLAGRAQAGAG